MRTVKAAAVQLSPVLHATPLPLPALEVTSVPSVAPATAARAQEFSGMTVRVHQTLVSGHRSIRFGSGRRERSRVCRGILVGPYQRPIELGLHLRCT